MKATVVFPKSFCMFVNLYFRDAGAVRRVLKKQSLVGTPFRIKAEDTLPGMTFDIPESFLEVDGLGNPRWLLK